jgi:hypothetical protein
VRGTPLSAGNDSPIAKIIDELPDDMVVFSSDFPHFEGFTDPIGHYAVELAELKPDAASASSAARSPRCMHAWDRSCSGRRPRAASEASGVRAGGSPGTDR